MPRFIMLDHSLKGVGGHHYEYALNVLRSAEAAGFDIVLGTHTQFQPPAEFAQNWLVVPVFQLSAYSDYSIFRGDAVQTSDQEVFLSRPISPWIRLWDAICGTCDPRNLSRTHRRAARSKRHYLRGRWEKVREYARECEQFFRHVACNKGDIVYVPTLTEFDLERLVGFLSTQPASRVVSWHLQFHFNFLDGRESDYLQQARRLSGMQRYFRELLAQIPRHKVFLYTTTLPLAQQYDRLEVAQFQPLAYPVNEAIRPAQVGRSHEPLRVSSAGCVRLEKGCLHVEPLIRDLWNGYFQKGRLQLMVQSDQKEKDFTIRLPGGGKPLRANNVAEAIYSEAPVVCIRAPLPVDEYVSLIQSTDIGLFLYDSERYYTRCSGVLVEMLAAGVPVIVPAGCWLSEQIAEQVYEHRDQLIQDVPALSVVSLSDLANQQQDIVMEGANRVVELPVPASATHLLVTVQQDQPTLGGVFVRVTAEALDAQSQPLKPFTEIVGSRINGRSPSSMIPVRENATCLRVSLTNAYDSGELKVADAQFHFFSANSVPDGLATGAVGLIAAGPEQIADLLEDMTANYHHYRDSARKFSHQWRREHHPQRTIEALLANSGLPQQEVESRQRQVA